MYFSFFLFFQNNQLLYMPQTNQSHKSLCYPGTLCWHKCLSSHWAIIRVCESIWQLAKPVRFVIQNPSNLKHAIIPLLDIRSIWSFCFQLNSKLQLLQTHVSQFINTHGKPSVNPAKKMTKMVCGIFWSYNRDRAMGANRGRWEPLLTRLPMIRLAGLAVHTVTNQWYDWLDCLLTW